VFDLESSLLRLKSGIPIDLSGKKLDIMDKHSIVMISLVIPVYNEEKLLDELNERCIAVCEKIGHSYEVIYVDDGSYDGTLDKLLEFHYNNKNVKIIELSRNFGHQKAFSAGLEASSGDYTVMLDGDLQDEPELIEGMFNMIKNGEYDIIKGYRTARQENGFRKLFIALFHFIFKWTSGYHDMKNTGNFSMFNRKALKALLSMKEQIRYLPGLRSYIGFRQGIMEYERVERKAGRPKMNFNKLFRLASDAIFSFSRMPIVICFYIGLIGATFFMFSGFYILLSRTLGWHEISWSLQGVGLFFLGSVQLVFLGILGEYIWRTYRESQHRPLYIVRNTYFDEE